MTHLESIQTFKMELPPPNKVNSFMPLTASAQSIILNAGAGSKYSSDIFETLAYNKFW